MMDRFPYTEVLYYLATAAGAFAVGLLIERLARRSFLKWAERTEVQWDDWVAKRGFHLVPSVLLVVLATRILVAVRPPGASVETLVTAGLGILFVLAGVRIVADLATTVIRFRSEQLGVAGVSILRNTLTVVAAIVGVLLVLDQLGISVAPLLATLGVGGIALALALQPTLGNIFAGIQLVAAKEFQVGDFVRVTAADLHGYVKDIGWRTTTFTTLGNDVIVPNSLLADSIIMNHNTSSEPQLRIRVPVGVHYGSDLEEVERITLQTIRWVQDNTTVGVTGFEGQIRWTGFGDSAVTFDAILQTAEPRDRHDIASAFIKRLHHCYRDEGIEIPYPIRTLEFGSAVEVLPPTDSGEARRDLPRKA